MRLSEFILSNLPAILREWESFAGSILPEKELDRLMLRDDAEEILKAIALDMETPQTELEQAEKSQGCGARAEHDSAAGSHGAARFGMGFNQAQVVSEFRALRASVIQLWRASSPEVNDAAIDQLIRFNEGMDQAVSASTDRFMQEIGKSRDFAMAVLAHDLRNPLNSMLTSAQYLQRLMAKGRDRAAITEIGSSIISSGMHMSKLITNLLDFTRTRLGQHLPVKKELTDLAHICRQTVDELVAAYPGRMIHLNCTGALQGFVDATRISQMLSNLITNAIQHGAETTPITVTAGVESDEIVLQVHNDGPPIPPSKLPMIFDLLGSSAEEGKEYSHLGIGLYIAREVVEAHSGNISVTSTAQDGTTFVVRLPRHSTDDHST